MKIEKLQLQGLLVIQPELHRDERGYFTEIFRKEWFRLYNADIDFVQDNESCSAKGVLRGLHYQDPPWAQGKLVRVVRGFARDVAVDIRTGSPTFGKWVAFDLRDDELKMIYIPPGFAHGFLSLKENTLLQYKCTAYYNKKADRSIRWSDPDLNIDWGFENPVLSDKDRNAPLLRETDLKF